MIDKQTLTIGSHVLLNGERVEVEAIYSNNRVITKGVWQYKTYAKHLDPIPITEELLTELGFEKCEERWVKNDNRHYPIFIELKSYKEKHFVSVVGGSMFLSYLHELEAFVYLTTKQKN